MRYFRKAKTSPRMIMSDKIVMITDETDICYGMLGKVIAEGNGLRACYQLLITGYENCIKAGYSDKDIKDHNLDERGFLYLISKTNCRVMTNKEMAVVYMNEIVTVDDLMQFPLSHCLNGENVDKAAVEAYKVRTAELLGVNLIQSTRCFREAKIPQGDVPKECWEKAQQMENAEFLKLVDEVEAKRWLKDVLASSAFAKYEPTKNEEDFER